MCVPLLEYITYGVPNDGVNLFQSEYFMREKG